MRAIVLALAIVLTGVVAGVRADDPAPAAFTGRVTDRSRVCMMQDSLQPKPGLAQEYEGKTYFLCCPMCAQSFNAAPERFAHARDPVTGEMVDKATAPAYAVKGKAYFSSEQSLDRFAKEPARYLGGS
jgi:YHS domain-containing protein